MVDKQLREDLEKLRAEIAGLDSDVQSKEKLSQLLMDIEQEVEQANLNQGTKQLAEQVETAISRFETSHPTLTGILNNIMVTLSGMGV